MPNKIKLLWEALSSAGGASGFRRIDALHVLDFYLGIDNEGRYTLLLICKEQPAFQSDLKSVKLISVARDDGRWSLFLILEDSKLFEFFSFLCEDLIESSRPLNVDQSLDFVLKRLSSWRQLFERGNLGLLSDSEVRGLCGELVHLVKLIPILGTGPAVNSWVGPYLSDQDFQIENQAWEVKTLRPGSSSTLISSEKQLDTKIRPIILVVIELGNCTSSSQGAFTLNSLVEDVRLELSADFNARTTFDRTLFKAGYIHRPEYDELNVVVRDVNSYDIRADFPRITISDVPKGVAHVVYKVDLTVCGPFKIS
ncbi:PD-(D/E)XK motif protein [Pseudomonas sp. NA-150]|uniref:PD-(D/E)XK motif protein n=1 Tax=Pseudomonas sp. NA-150 TaxID=3367525 RepID=UPI0037CC8344